MPLTLQLRKHLTLFLSVCSLFYAQCSLSAPIPIMKGMNYDPIHSLEYAKGMGLDNLDLMKTGIFMDLDRLLKFRHDNPSLKDINHLKTFYTLYSSTGINPARPRVSFNIADVVAEWNAKQLPESKITLALGVYEFLPDRDGCGNECEQWTQTQIQEAVRAANEYGYELVDRIIVGSEDMQLNDSIRDRIARDAKTIKNQLRDPRTMVGTAQISVFVKDMLDPASPNYTQYQGIKNAVDFIGTNVYPFWQMGSSAGIDYGRSQNSPVKEAILNYWNALTALHNEKELIITEEGWPSAGNNNGTSKPDPALEYDYFYYWHNRWMDGPVSYYFSLYDRFPGQSMESHWGILAADRTYSITEGDHSKPLDETKQHITINFNNEIETQSKARTASLYACTADWDSPMQWQDSCYPIYGAPSIYQGDISPASSKKIMVDKSGAVYKSILVLFYGEDNKPTVLCHINSTSLSQLHDQENLTLDKVNPDGSCQLEESTVILKPTIIHSSSSSSMPS